MKTQIPIYRAKKIDSDESVKGTPLKVQEKTYMVQNGTSDLYLDSEENFDDGSLDGEIRIFQNIFEIDISTLSISFEDMIDSEGTKIFASLSKDGKGGDNLNGKFMLFVDNIDVVCKLYATEIVFSGINRCDHEDKLPLISYSNMKNLKVTGIQQ